MDRKPIEVLTKESERKRLNKICALNLSFQEALTHALAKNKSVNLSIALFPQYLLHFQNISRDDEALPQATLDLQAIPKPSLNLNSFSSFSKSNISEAPKIIAPTAFSFGAPAKALPCSTESNTITPSNHDLTKNSTKKHIDESTTFPKISQSGMEIDTKTHSPTKNPSSSQLDPTLQSSSFGEKATSSTNNAPFNSFKFEFADSSHRPPFSFSNATPEINMFEHKTLPKLDSTLSEEAAQSNPMSQFDNSASNVGTSVDHSNAGKLKTPNFSFGAPASKVVFGSGLENKMDYSPVKDSSTESSKISFSVLETVETKNHPTSKVSQTEESSDMIKNEIPDAQMIMNEVHPSPRGVEQSDSLPDEKSSNKFSFGSAIGSNNDKLSSQTAGKFVTPFSFSMPTTFSFSMPPSTVAGQEAKDADEGDEDDDAIPAGEEESFGSLKRTDSELLRRGVGEEGEETLVEERIKLFVLEKEKGWVDLGLGWLKINEQRREGSPITDKSKRRLIFRLEGSGKILLNTWLNSASSSITPYVEESKALSLTCFNCDGKIGKYLVRCKSSEIAASIYKNLKDSLE